MKHKIIVPFLAILLLTACSSLYKTTVTITSVVDSAMRDWAQLSAQGKTTPQIDAAVIRAHDAYREACGVAQKALVTYKTTGTNNEYIAALNAVQAAASGIIDMLTPLLAPSKAATLKTNLQKASSL